MTKKKTKKMTKSTFAIIIMGIALVALLAFGGTFAYFTSTSSQRTSKFTTAVVNLKSSGGSSINFAANKVESRETISDKGIQLVNHSNVKTIVAVQFEITYNGQYYLSKAVNHDGSSEATPTADERYLMALYRDEYYNAGKTRTDLYNFAKSTNFMWDVRTPLDTTKNTQYPAYVPGEANGIDSNRLAAHEVTEAFFSYNTAPTGGMTEAQRWTGLVTGTNVGTSNTVGVGLGLSNAPYDNVNSPEQDVYYKWVQGTGIYSNVYLLNTYTSDNQGTTPKVNNNFVLPESRPETPYVQDGDGTATGQPADSNVIGGGDDWVSDGESKYDFFPSNQNVTFKIDRNYLEFWEDKSNNDSQEDDEAYEYGYVTDAANKLPTKLNERFLLWADADVIFSVRAYQIQVEHVHTFGEMTGTPDPYTLEPTSANVGLVWEAIANLVGGSDPTADHYGREGGADGYWGADPKTYA